MLLSQLPGQFEWLGHGIASSQAGPGCLACMVYEDAISSVQPI